MRTLINVILLLASVAAFAVPARRGPRKVTQPDGTELVVYAHGDEHFHWLTDADGRWLKKDAQGWYVETPALTQREIQARRAMSPYRTAEAVQSPRPLNIAPRGLVILAQTKDKKFETDKAVIDTMLNGQNFTREYDYEHPQNGKTYHVTSSGSARQYFYASSFGQYNPRFDVVGPVTLSKAMSYYGAGTDCYNPNVPEMIREACDSVSKLGTDFSLYDNDNDNYVDFVYVIYAGYGENDGGGDDTVWPHKSTLSGNYQITRNGKTVRLYACGSEMNYYSKVFYGIGVFCHEFGHVLGLPDMYASSESMNWKTLGEWDIMDYPYTNDANSPAIYSGYERFFLGWATPRLLVEPENVTLHDLAATNEVLIVSPDGTHNMTGNNPYPQTFYVLENRRKSGWYAEGPGEGMLITKVAYNYSKWSGYINDNETEMGVDIIEADGQAPEYPDAGWYGRQEDTYPTGADFYKDIPGNPITEIKDKDGVITFKFKGGAASPVTQVENTGHDTNAAKWLWHGRIYLNINGQLYDILGNENHLLQR